MSLMTGSRFCLSVPPPRVRSGARRAAAPRRSVPGWRLATTRLTAEAGPRIPNLVSPAAFAGPSALVQREFQGNAVHAIAQTGRRRAVVEDVAKVAAAAPAPHLGPFHQKTPVGFGPHRAFDWTPEARPARPALELGLRFEERQLAAGTSKNILAMLLQQRAAEGPFGALVSENLILVRREQAPPFLVGLLHLELLRFGHAPNGKDTPLNCGNREHQP